MEFVRFESQAQQRFQDELVHPAGRARIPRPAAASRVRRKRIDVRREDVRLRLIKRNRIRRLRMIDWIDEGEQFPRALGIAVHSMLEEAARLREKLNWDETRLELAKSQARAVAQVRSAGVDRRQANQIAQQAMDIALSATRDSIGQWILSPHADAASEVRWAGVIDSGMRTVQVDRVFRAGKTALSEDGDCWWIVDYKTAHASDLDGSSPETILPQLRTLFAPQLHAYAEVLRKLHGNDVQINAGLYYPRMLLFDYWEI